MISIKNIPNRGPNLGEGNRRSDEVAAARSCGHSERTRRGEGASGGPGGDLRCGCGSLLAKLVSGAVELKCRRCKQTWRIPLEAG